MKKMLFAAAGVLTLLASCSKDTNSGAPAPSLIGKWQLDNYSFRFFRQGKADSNKLITRDSMPACALDDYWEYRADSTGRLFLGKPCANDTAQSVSFRWTLQGNVLIQIFADGHREGMTISNINQDYYTTFDTLYPAPGQPDTGTLLQQYKRIP